MEVPFLLFDISSGELFLIVLAVLILFGPKQIPVIARTIGKGLFELRKASDQLKNEVMKEASEVRSTMTEEQPQKNKPEQNELKNKAEPNVNKLDETHPPVG
jgi:Sec-independent protein translocase protein TatA